MRLSAQIRRCVAAALVIGALFAGGCGAAQESTAGAPAEEVVTTSESSTEEAVEHPQPEANEDRAGGFSGQDARNYESAKEVCGGFPRSQVAKEVGLDPHADPGDIAQAYSRTYRPAFRQAVFEGCLAGL